MKFNCLYQNDQVKCTNPDKWLLAPILCPAHLKLVYGLHLWYPIIDGATHKSIVGPYLQPEDGVYFKKNTVVFPDRNYIDNYFLPNTAIAQQNHFNYDMNPAIKKFFNNLLQVAQIKGANTDVIRTSRFHFEILRNTPVDSKDVNLSQNDQDQYINLKTKIQDKLASSEFTIKNMPIYQSQFSQQSIASNNDPKVTVTLDNFSNSFAYKLLLTHCIFDTHEVPVTQPVQLPTVPFNLTYIKGIGFVTTEGVGHPCPFVLEGEEKGTLMWYNNKVNIVEKDIRNRDLTMKDVTGFPGLTHNLRGGSDNCIW